MTSCFQTLRMFRLAYLNKTITKYTGLSPINQTEKDDVFVVGYPKSGNTWMQYLIARMFYGVICEEAPDVVVQELVPDVHYNKYYKRFSSPTFFKSHFLPSPDYQRVVYLVRDGRDVMVSYMHYLSATRGKSIDMLNLLRTEEGLFPCKWHEHVEAWLENPWKARLLVIKYEDLHRDAVGELRKLCEFSGHNKSLQVLEAAIKGASIDVMKRREASQGWANPVWPRDKSFVRTGLVGGYKNEMGEEEQEIFMSYSGVVMKKMGYV
ncbi:MAG: sulfotransferase domain-containing protein [Kiritimatiellae bacterium]|nr:sulfotransferase domain-containing protein [Kiritimatiellia bacterium]MDD5521920.1 sulfotransferase domain-containing protein [Kiritimatiellia bacterium]